jgi:hypothetical protein
MVSQTEGELLADGEQQITVGFSAEEKGVFGEKGETSLQLKVGQDEYRSPRHPLQREPSFLELNPMSGLVIRRDKSR